MGQFSYVCPACGKAINGYEVVHFKHIRHGKLLGETVGHHDGYGRANGSFEGADPYYRIWKDELPEKMSDYPNTHEDICVSEFSLEDSIGFDGKIYEGKPYTWMQLRDLMGYGDITPPEDFYELWRSLPEYKPETIASGTSAYHEYCYRRLTDEEKAENVISDHDPNQGWGRSIKKYVDLN